MQTWIWHLILSPLKNVLTTELQEKCEGLLTKDECFRAVKLMKKKQITRFGWDQYRIL